METGRLAVESAPDIEIEDSSDKLFRKLFDMLRGIFTGGQFTPDVLQAIRGLPERDWIRIRDHYLILLHHLGESESKRRKVYKTKKAHIAVGLAFADWTGPWARVEAIDFQRTS